MTLNDAKHAALLVLTGETSGHIDDLEALWVASLSAGLQATYLNTTLLFDWLRDIGYVGTLNDKLYQFWTDGGDIATLPPVNAVTHLTFPVRNAGEYVTNT